MSIHDTIRCRHPLPVKVPEDTVFQTKSFPNPYHHEYEIREDGSLWVFDSWPIGHQIKDWQPCIYSGTLHMYTDLEGGGWLEIRMQLESGVVMEIRVEEYERPDLQ